MEYTVIEEKVNEFLIDEFEIDGDTITPEANMIETLDLDSLDYVDMVVIIESIFGFKMTAEDFKEITTFKDFYTFLHNKVNTPVSSAQ